MENNEKTLQIGLTEDSISEITKESLIYHFSCIYEDFMKCEFTGKGSGFISYEFEEDILAIIEIKEAFKKVLEYYGVDTFTLIRDLREKYIKNKGE